MFIVSPLSHASPLPVSHQQLMVRRWEMCQSRAHLSHWAPPSCYGPFNGGMSISVGYLLLVICCWVNNHMEGALISNCLHLSTAGNLPDSDSFVASGMWRGWHDRWHKEALRDEKVQQEKYCNDSLLLAVSIRFIQDTTSSHPHVGPSQIKRLTCVDLSRTLCQLCCFKMWACLNL